MGKVAVVDDISSGVCQSGHSSIGKASDCRCMQTSYCHMVRFRVNGLTIVRRCAHSPQAPTMLMTSCASPRQTANMLMSRIRVASGLWANHMCTPCPHRLVVRTSRCGRDNPGSTFGEEIVILLARTPLNCCTGQGVGMDRYGSQRHGVGRCGWQLLIAARLAP